MSLVALLLAAATPAVTDAPIASRQSPAVLQTASVTAQIIRGERIDFDALQPAGDPRKSTRRDKYGTFWIEFS